jgi:hypothetical protein
MFLSAATVGPLGGVEGLDCASGVTPREDAADTISFICCASETILMRLIELSAMLKLNADRVGPTK